MTEQSGTGGSAEITTMACRVCQHDVPAAKFCGRCGAHLTRSRGEGPDWLRIGDYAAAPGENVLQPSLVSSMFPHLPNRSQGAFRVGLALVAVVLSTLCLLRLWLPMVVVAAFAPLFLFVVYLVETGVFADLPRRVWLLTFVLGIGVGVGWAWLTSSIVAESYSLGLGTEVPTARLVRDAVLLPFGALLAMQLPTVLIRLIRSSGRDSLYGFVIGALGATLFTLAATMVRLVPALAGAMSTADQTVTELFLEAAVRGFTMPLTAAAVGGLFGAGLWYGRGEPGNRVGRLALTGLGLVSAAALYAIVGVIDAFRVPPDIQFVVHLVLALAAVIALRIGLQLAMLHEPQESMHPELPILCPDCGHVVPDMAFCPACGVGSHAASLTSRETRRLNRPQPDEEVTPL